MHGNILYVGIVHACLLLQYLYQFKDNTVVYSRKAITVKLHLPLHYNT